MHRGVPSNYWGKIQSEVGSFNKKEVDLEVGTKLTDRLKTTVNYGDENTKGYRDGEKKREYNLEIETEYDIEDGEVAVEYSKEHEYKSKVGSLTKKQYESDRRQNKYKGRRIEDTEEKYKLRYDKEWSKNFSSLGSVEYNKEYYEYRYPKDGKTPPFKRKDKDSKNILLNQEVTYKYGDREKITFGVDYSQSKLKKNSFKASSHHKIYKSSFTDTKYYAIGGYVENEFGVRDFLFSQRLNVEKNNFKGRVTRYYTSGRIKSNMKEKYDPTDVDLQLGGKYYFDEDNFVFVNFNHLERSPSVSEYSSWDSDMSPDKKIEKMQKLEIGNEYSNKKILVKTSVYFSQTKNEIVFDSGREDKLGSYYNLDGKSQKAGVEVESKQYLDKFTFREKVSYTCDKIVSGMYKGKKMPDVPRYVTEIGLSYEIVEDLVFDIENKYYGRHYFANDFKNEHGKTQSYAITNISLEYEIKKGVSLYGGIDNIFGKKYYNYAYLSDDVEKFYSAPERTYYIGMKVEL